MLEPLWSIEPDLWLIYADWLSDRDDYTGEARARRIALTLASGRTGLYLEFQHVEEDRSKVSAVHYTDRVTCLADPGRGAYRWLTHSEWDVGASYREFHSTDTTALNPSLKPEAFAYRPDVARAFFDRLAELGPLLWLSEDSPTVDVPASVAVCPECGGALRGTVEGWTVENATPFTVMLNCVRDEDAWDAPGYLRDGHRYRQSAWHSSAWQPVRDTVERWARDTVRVRTTERR